MKTTLLAVILLLTTIAKAQKLPWDNVPPHTQSVYIENMVHTQYKSPMTSLMFQQSTTDERSKVTFVIKAGVWYHPIVPKSNFFVVQLGATYPLTKKADVGIYCVNFNGRLPRPQYDSFHLQKDVGYHSPFSVYVNTYPFKNKKLSCSSEFMYFLDLRRVAFRIAINYRVFNKENK